MKLRNILLLTVASMFFASCDSSLSPEALKDISLQYSGENENITIKGTAYSDYHQRMKVQINASKSLANGMRLDDSKKIRVKARDNYEYVIPLIEPSQPTVESVKYVVPEQLYKSGYKCLVLVDLCQSSAAIKKQHDYVRIVQRMFSHNNLFIAFMLPHGKVSNIIPATNYVIDNYINVNASILNTQAYQYSLQNADSMPVTMQHAYLYRSVAHILTDVMGSSGTGYDNALNKILLVFSDGQVYNDNNMPIDPKHFEMQEALISMSKRLKGNVHMYYVGLAAGGDPSLADNNVMQMLCKASEGRYASTFNAYSFKNHIAQDCHQQLTDYEVTLRYTKGSILMGNDRVLRLTFTDRKTKQTVAQCSHYYWVGSLYAPIVVGDVSEVRLYVMGTVLALLLFGIAYLILQLVIPYVQNRRFETHYIHKYTGPNMSINGKIVAEKCYFCKAPFQIGDEIVAKCKHTMHHDCWNENGQHCPEHGRHCPEGSHYYNKLQLFDPRNGSFYIMWIALSSLAVYLSWLYTSAFSHYPIFHLLENTVSSILTNNEDPDVARGLVQYGSSSLYLMQVFASSIAFFLTIVMSYLSSYHRLWYMRILDNVLKGVVAAAITFGIFYAQFCGLVACDQCDDVFLVDVLIWILMTYIIMFISTYYSRIKIDPRRFVIFGAAAGIIGAVAWEITGMQESIFQFVGCVILQMFYGASVVYAIAKPLPTHDHSLLRVNGEIKEMEIALYKWLKQSDNAIVTIGRSVDCSLQLSWDTKSSLAPVVAEICQKHGAILITALAGGVLMRHREIPEGEWEHLYHGDTFTIGTTKFTYIEL